MELNWVDAIDTACTRCSGDAVDWVMVRDGTRRYACQECLEALLRYGTADSLAALPDTPEAVVCLACDRLTLFEDTGPANKCPDCQVGDEGERLRAEVQEALDEQRQAQHEQAQQDEV